MRENQEIIGKVSCAEYQGVIGHIKSDFNKILQSQFVQIMEEVQAVLQNKQMNGVYKVEKIAGIYERRGRSTGNCHGFG